MKVPLIDGSDDCKVILNELSGSLVIPANPFGGPVYSKVIVLEFGQLRLLGIHAGIDIWEVSKM